MPKLKDGEQTVYFKAGGEWCFLRTPKDYRASEAAGNAVPCLIRCRGLGNFVKERESDWEKSAYHRPLIDFLVGQGYAVAGSDLTGDHWGRPSAVAANVSLYETLMENCNIDGSRVGMLNAGGRGAMVLWNTAIGPLLGKVRAVALTHAVVSLESMAPHRRELICEAYGMSKDTPLDVVVSATAGHDPLAQTRLMIQASGEAIVKSLPKVAIFHGDRDPQVPFEKNALALAKLLSDNGATVAVTGYYGMGHDLHARGEPTPQVLYDFFRRAFEA
ncbi:MAG: hypothetical protein FJ320_11860 [SAR202 cluster bacterium]|nr:hypothetical protein [SAR202 cluster bacterium]